MATILLVDDNDQNLELLEACLAPAGHTLVLARDGAQALSAAADPAIDLVLLDVMMPRVSGFEACATIRKSRPKLPILLVTALNASGDHERAQAAGANGLLPKPFKRQDLIQRVDALLANKASH